MRKPCAIWLVGLSLTWSCLGQGQAPMYHMDFQSAQVDKVPEEFLVLDGAFSVKEEDGNKFLQLPGAPLDTFGLLFGPTARDGIAAAVRVYGTAKGRRFPTFALGLNGAGGYRIQVSPGRKALELYRGDFVKQSVPFEWQSGKWTHLRLQVRKTSAGWRIEGKAWQDGKEPADWMISADEPEELPAGRASVFGSPFSGTPIRYDDLIVAPAK